MIAHLTSALAFSPIFPRSRTARLDSPASRRAIKKQGSLIELCDLALPSAELRAVLGCFSTRAARNRAIDVAAQHETGLYTHEISAISEAA